MEGFQQLRQATGKGLVDGAEAACGGEGSGLEGIVIHHAFLFDLLGDAFGPFSLGLGPEEALGGNHPGHGGIDVLPNPWCAGRGAHPQ